MTATSDTHIRADVDPRHYLRFVLIGMAAVGFALWCLYDGAVAYPAQRVRALEYQRLEEEGHEKGWKEKEVNEEWKKIAQQNGWPTIPPGEPKIEAEFVTQYVMASLAGAIGLTFLTIWFRSRGRWIEGDDTALRSSWGQSVEYNQIVSLNKKLWRKKGIAKVVYQDGGRTRRFVVDDYKFLRGPTDAILLQLESQIDLDKITGGPPESAAEQIVAETTDAAEDKTAPAE